MPGQRPGYQPRVTSLAPLRPVVRRGIMSDQKPPRQLFPESRLMLGMLSPVLGVFFGACVYFTGVWQPFTFGERLGKFALEDILFTFITLCGVGFIASVVGPHRIRPLIGTRWRQSG